ncbi:MAG: hypothetical protein F6K55_13180 [Moorea sp. SIO4A3]|nr:hypothetical protein [Moorena sp. SIO4A3]NEQ83223.1 hypothetical protein [Moorena sp. SIO2I5]
MFQATSRYYNLETATFTSSDNRVISYKRRRFLPQGETLSLLVEVTVTEGDRLDLITDSNLGDAEQFWQVCDANNTMNPFDLTAEPSKVLRVPQPQL